ncbi:MAG: PaaI family thioesterase [Nocardioidaceae bacterium]
MDANAYQRMSLTPEEAAEHDRVFGSLTRATREFMEAQLLTRVGHDEVADVQAALEALTARLRKDAADGPLGVEVDEHGSVRAHGNAVVGLRNPVAPPLRIERSKEGRAWSSFHLGPAYEGPPGLVHGGVSALLLDQLCGEAAAAGGAPGMTGRLTLHYRLPTPLGWLSAEAWVDDTDGVKTVVRGAIRDPEGRTTVEAEGLFILPRWAREAMAKAQPESPRPEQFE